MTFKQKLAGILVAIAALWSGGSAVLGGLTSDTFSYKAVNGSNASSTFGYQVRGGAGVLGSVVIGQPASTTAIRIYDGINSSASDRTGTSSATLIATINATSTTGAYGPVGLDYNVSFTKGLILDIPVGYGGNITVTSK